MCGLVYGHNIILSESFGYPAYAASKVHRESVFVLVPSMKQESLLPVYARLHSRF